MLTHLELTVLDTRGEISTPTRRGSRAVGVVRGREPAELRISAVGAVGRRADEDGTVNKRLLFTDDSEDPRRSLPQWRNEGRAAESGKGDAFKP